MMKKGWIFHGFRGVQTWYAKYYNLLLFSVWVRVLPPSADGNRGHSAPIISTVTFQTI